jgi:hypothetical protein
VTAIAPFTNDGDLAVDPVALVPVPRLEDAMKAQGFDLDASEVGRWRNKRGVIVDLLVPEALGGPGRRGARLGPHGKVAARKVRGLEAALVDCEDPTHDDHRHMLSWAGGSYDAEALYDFGDGWEHEIAVEGVVTPDPTVQYPWCLTGKRACPPEDLRWPARLREISRSSASAPLTRHPPRYLIRRNDTLIFSR